MKNINPVKLCDSKSYVKPLFKSIYFNEYRKIIMIQFSSDL